MAKVYSFSVECRQMPIRSDTSIGLIVCSRVWAGRQADGLSDTCIGLVVRRDGQAGG